MKNYFDIILNTYLLDNSKRVNSNAEYYSPLTLYLPHLINKYTSEMGFSAKGSCGNGNKAECPWICIFNGKVTTTATHGIYICYLFKTDMSGFYLTIGQGITNFTNKYKKNDAYYYARKVANYFKKEIADDYFSKADINLQCRNGSLGYGYEQDNVISKYYQKDNFTEEELINDLKRMVFIYNEICDSMKGMTYDEVIENIISNTSHELVLIDEANKMIEEALLTASAKKQGEITILEEIKKPEARKNKYVEIEKKKIKKIDYIEKAKKNTENGLLGELLVNEYEKARLLNLGRPDLAAKIEWLSIKDDTLGYDIHSFDLEKDNKVIDIYIEVKTTELGSQNCFFMSYKEVETMNQNSKNYWIYRVFYVNTEKPKFYKINGKDFDEVFKLSTFSYTVDLL